MKIFDKCVTFYRRIGDVQVFYRDQCLCGRHGSDAFEALAHGKARHLAPHKQATSWGVDLRACVGLVREIWDCTGPVALSCAADPYQLRLASPSCVAREVSASVSCVGLILLKLAERPNCHGNEAFWGPDRAQRSILARQKAVYTPKKVAGEPQAVLRAFFFPECRKISRLLGKCLMSTPSCLAGTNQELFRSNSITIYYSR